MPMLSLDSSITGLAGVENISKGHPVFLLVADDRSHVVVKHEKTTDQVNLQRNFTTMGMASPQARSVILKPDEVTELKAFVQFCKDAEVENRRLFPVPPDVAYLELCLQMGGTWFKMNKVEGYMDLNGAALKLLLNADKSGVRAIAKALNQSGGLEALGKIVAADMFNNNGDRFQPFNSDNGVGKAEVKSEGASVQQYITRSLVNIGNVMAALSGSQLTMVGLDTWDPFSIEGQHDMDTPVNRSWLGTVLGHDQKQRRLEFARDMTNDLNMVLGPRNRKFGFLQQTRLGSDAPGRINTGMEKTIKKIIQAMENTVARGNPPAGLASRLLILRGR